MSRRQKIANIALAMFFLGLLATVLILLLAGCAVTDLPGMIKADCVEQKEVVDDIVVCKVNFSDATCYVLLRNDTPSFGGIDCLEQ